MFMTFDYLMQLWKQPWTHWFVFFVSLIIFYLPISTIMYSQYVMWTKNLSSKLAVYIFSALAILAGSVCAFYVVSVIQMIFKWYTSGMGPPLPYAVAPLAYQPFWIFVFTVTIIIACTPIWWAAVSLSKIVKMFTIYVASKFRATSISNERAKKE